MSRLKNCYLFHILLRLVCKNRWSLCFNVSKNSVCKNGLWGRICRQVMRWISPQLKESISKLEFLSLYESLKFSRVICVHKRSSLESCHFGKNVSLDSNAIFNWICKKHKEHCRNQGFFLCRQPCASAYVSHPDKESAIQKQALKEWVFRRQQFLVITNRCRK